MRSIPSKTRSAMISAQIGAMPKPILNPPLAIEAPGCSGWAPNIGARDRALGRTPCPSQDHRGIRQRRARAPGPIDHVVELVVGAGGVVIVPLRCGADSDGANRHGARYGSHRQRSAAPRQDRSPTAPPALSRRSPTVRPTARVIASKSATPVAQTSIPPICGASVWIVPPLARMADAKASVARRGWMRAVRVSRIISPVGDGQRVGSATKTSHANCPCQWVCAPDARA